MADFTVIRCGEGPELDELPGLGVADRQPCSECGSLLRANQFFGASSLVPKGQNQQRARAGTKVRGKPTWVLVQGDDFHHDSGTWRRLYRLFDRRIHPARYVERILDSEGNAVVDQDEPLAAHQGHGSAKRRTRR